MKETMLRARMEFLRGAKGLDEAWYQQRCSVAAASGMEPLQHYLDYGSRAGIAPNAYLEQLQNGGDFRGSVKETIHGNCDKHLALEMKLVEAAGLFDADYYLHNNPGVAKKRLDPLLHFCRQGWRELRNPHPEFDVWWYWSCYLDPRREGINPAVHHALLGQYAGHVGRPPRYEPNRERDLALGSGPRRICLLAGFDPDGIVDDYVVRLAKELGRFSDVYYLADCVMRDGELEKLRPYVIGCWAYRHARYDFGSWSKLAGGHVGWDAIEKYDELLLVNDSAYLVGDIDRVFQTMQDRGCDWWGLQATKGMLHTCNVESNRFSSPVPVENVRAGLVDQFRDDYIYDFHLGSYFLAFRVPVIADQGFRWRITAPASEAVKSRLIRKCEIGLTQYLVGRQFHFDTFISRVFPLHPLFTAHHFSLIEEGFPFFKRLLLISNHYNVPDLENWKAILAVLVPDAPLEEMERNLLRVADHARLNRSFSISRDETGSVNIPKLMGAREFRSADASTIKDDDWWAFPVDIFTGVLGGDERAVFEAVRRNPSIKKIILTRWRDFSLDGENVEVAPLRSPEGEAYLLRARQLLVANSLKEDVVFPVSEALRNVISLRTVSSPEDVAAGGEVTTTSDTTDDEYAGAAYEDFPPRMDLICQPRDLLPEDMIEEIVRLEKLSAGRRLLVYLVGTELPLVDAIQVFPLEEVARFQIWLRDNRLCLGIRGHRGTDVSTYHEIFRGPDVFCLSERRFPNQDLVYRSTLAVITDSVENAEVFHVAGGPVFEYAADSGLDENHTAADDDSGITLDLVAAHPDFSALSSVIERMLMNNKDEADPVEGGARFGSPYLGYQNAGRAVQFITDAYRVEVDNGCVG